MAKSIIKGRAELVENKYKKPTANSKYIRIPIEDENGKNEITILLTEYQFRDGIARAKRNPEDLGKKSCFRDLLD